MKKLLLVGLCLLAMGCKGKNGSNGSTGIQGIKGEDANIQVLTGNIISDDFFVFDPDISQAIQVSVYINNGGVLFQMPVYLPSLGYNAFYLVDRNTSRIEIFKGLLAGGQTFFIVLTL